MNYINITVLFHHSPKRYTVFLTQIGTYTLRQSPPNNIPRFTACTDTSRCDTDIDTTDLFHIDPLEQAIFERINIHLALKDNYSWPFNMHFTPDV